MVKMASDFAVGQKTVKPTMTRMENDIAPEADGRLDQGGDIVWIAGETASCEWLKG